MFNSNYSVSPNAPQHSRFHYDETPAPEERSASNRYQDEYEQGGDRYYQQHQKHSQHSYSDRHSPPSRPSRDDRAPLSSSASSLQPSGSLRRKSQQDWARPRGTSGSSLRPDPQPTQRPRTPVDENSAVLERMRAGGWMGVGQGSSSGHGEDEGYATSFHGSMDSGYGSGYGGEEGKGGGLGSWSALKKAVGFGDEDARELAYYSILLRLLSPAPVDRPELCGRRLTLGAARPRRCFGLFDSHRRPQICSRISLLGQAHR